MKDKQRIFSWITLGLLSCLFSCDNTRVYEAYQSMPTMQWHESDTVTFDLDPVPDAPVKGTIGIKYNGDYDFHNLYVKYLLTDSLGNIRENELINVSLFDSKTGKPKGKGFGNTYTLYDTIPFLATGTQGLKVHFIQYMRVDPLKGIEAVGVKIDR